jgi:hypothetical protein
MEVVKASHWVVQGLPEYKEKITVEGRDYILQNYGPGTDELGNSSLLIVWEGRCVVCGDKFKFKSPKNRFVPTATCRKHWGQA